MDWVKTTARRHEEQLSFEKWCDLYWRFYGNVYVFRSDTKAPSQCNDDLWYGIPIIYTKDRLIFIMGIPIQVRRYLYNERVSGYASCNNCDYCYLVGFQRASRDYRKLNKNPTSVKRWEFVCSFAGTLSMQCTHTEYNIHICSVLKTLYTRNCEWTRVFIGSGMSASVHVQNSRRIMQTVHSLLRFEWLANCIHILWDNNTGAWGTTRIDQV